MKQHVSLSVIKIDAVVDFDDQFRCSSSFAGRHSFSRLLANCTGILPFSKGRPDSSVGSVLSSD